MLRELLGISKSLPVHMQSVDLGSTTIKVPVADLQGKRPGKTLLVTGGMDGDEYTGMEAAYHLIDEYKSGDFAGRLIVIPIVNIPGFEHECSQNPLDDVFPKHVFPGRLDGKPTERLLHWLTTSYVQHADVWHDLHAGAITEGLNPFVWFYKSGVQAVDKTAQELYSGMNTPCVVHEQVSGFSKAGHLAKGGCVYIIAESGQLGVRNSVDIDRHIDWIKSTMKALGMIETIRSGPPTSPTILTKVDYVMAPFDGIWRPSGTRSTLQRNDTLGMGCRIDGSDMREIRASTSGTPLWWKESMAMHKGDILCAIGH